MQQTEQQRKNEEDLFADHPYYQPVLKKDRSHRENTSRQAKDAWKPLDGIELN